MDSFFLCGQFSGEFLDVDPRAIFVKRRENGGVQFTLSNFGVTFVGNNIKKYFNLNDLYFTKKKSLENFVRSYLFAIGQLLYNLMTLEGEIEMSVIS